MNLGWNLTREATHYRHDCFTAGLRAVGLDVRKGIPNTSTPGDALVIWNRYGQYDHIAKQFERGGGTVIVAENGFCGKDADGRQYYAIAKHGHNGSGEWAEGGPERFAALGVALQPYRTDGAHILVCGQRGIGSPTMASPPDWHVGAMARLAKLTKRPIKLRRHPGNAPAKVPLADDLRGAWACVIWSSGAGVEALTAGIPVLFDAPHWICAGAAGRIEQIEVPPVDDALRLAAMQRMAWAQWTLSEIAAGDPFRRLLA